MTSGKRNSLFWAAKILAVIISIVYIGYHINSRVSLLKDGERLIASATNDDSRYRIAVILGLMLINWAFEAIKWRRLISTIEPIGLFKAARSVLTGITISFFTPNRLGEFAGRILHLGEGHRIKGAMASFVGSSAQLLVTLQAGIIALIIIAPGLMELTQPLSVMLVILLISSFGILTIAWFKVPLLANLFERISWLKKYYDFGEVFAHFHRNDLVFTYIFSAMRYLVFCTQQYILLQVFGVEVDYLTCLELSALSFLLITLVPSIALGELGVRGGINLLVFGKLTSDTSALLISTFSLWFINLALPAIAGAISLLYIRIWKEKQTEQI
jgi:hypothetical protein